MRGVLLLVVRGDRGAGRQCGQELMFIGRRLSWHDGLGRGLVSGGVAMVFIVDDRCVVEPRRLDLVLSRSCQCHMATVVERW
jgi:hypothetical protein